VSEKKETYLGDGLYASCDGYMICLRAPRGDRDDLVYLEPQVFVELFRMAHKIWEFDFKKLEAEVTK
jgi:hypothetical protein